MFEIIQIYVKSDKYNRIINDNYIYILHANGQAAVVDPSVAPPVLDALAEKNWNLDYIVNTHHHADHIGGDAELKQETAAKIIAYQGDVHRIHGVDVPVDGGDKIQICGVEAEVIFVPGHTQGQVSYYFKDAKSLFCGDTLFAMGCGRLLEGTAEQMFNSLQKLASLPDDTKVYCGHEYTENNGNFALTIEPDNQGLQRRMEEVRRVRADGKPTVPFTIGIEKETNPFLRANSAEAFAKLRVMKDNF